MSDAARSVTASADRRFRRGAWLAALIVYGAAAWYSTGYASADEHYQVIEFAEARLGHQPVQELAWEFGARIRSAALPAICYAVFKGANALGLSDPFLLTFLLRALTALLALHAVRCFVRATEHVLAPAWRKAYLFLSLFLWFLPFQYVRFAGETWSGLFVLLGLATVLTPVARSGRWLRGGLLLGAAFLFRPPTLLLALGLVLWLALVRRERVRPVATVLIGMVAMMLLGIAVDSWFYGSFTVTAARYLHLGVAGDADHPFTAYAWWYYFAWTVKHAIAPIGASVLLAFGVLVVKRPKDPLVWVLVPFLALHIVLPHKELRFLFPLAGLVPLLLVRAWDVLCDARTIGRPARRMIDGVLVLLLLVDVLALAVVSTTPAGSGRTTLAAALWRLPADRPLHLAYVADDPGIWRIRLPRFYRPPGLIDDGSAASCCDPRHDLSIAPDACGPPCTAIATTRTWSDRLRRLYDADTEHPWSLYLHEHRSPPSRP
ncbi:MAG: hypothetical protein JST66_06850 [Bacteroidetes bacterium]|nr:hypothetical protein [Bacteroidota bacterium]